MDRVESLLEIAHTAGPDIVAAIHRVQRKVSRLLSKGSFSAFYAFGTIQTRAMTSFDQDLQAATGDFPELTDNWSINGIPNGGYIMAVMTRAMMSETDKQATPILTASFINRCSPGPIDLQTEVVSRSRGFDRIASRLMQDGTERVRMMGTFAAASTECRMTRYEKPPLQLASRASCVTLPAFPKYTLYDRMEIRFDPECTGWMNGSPCERSELKGWIRFRDDRPLDLEAVILMADSFPPPVFATQGPVAWVPTLEMTVNVRNPPQGTWLKAAFRTRFVTCGLLESDGELWDEADQLIAISRQIAQYRSSSRSS